MKISLFGSVPLCKAGKMGYRAKYRFHFDRNVNFCTAKVAYVTFVTLRSSLTEKFKDLWAFNRSINLLEQQDGFVRALQRSCVIKIEESKWIIKWRIAIRFLSKMIFEQEMNIDISNETFESRPVRLIWRINLWNEITVANERKRGNINTKKEEITLDKGKGKEYGMEHRV